jgi:hypothetical protein
MGRGRGFGGSGVENGRMLIWIVWMGIVWRAMMGVRKKRRMVLDRDHRQRRERGRRRRFSDESFIERLLHRSVCIGSSNIRNVFWVGFRD